MSHLDEMLDKIFANLLLVPLGDILDDDLGLFQSAVAQKPARTLGDEPPVTKICFWVTNN